MYVHLKNVKNNINNSNDVGTNQIKLFLITFGGPTNSICSSIYYHMICNIEKVNIKLAKDLEHDTLHIGYLFCHKRLNLFMPSLKIG